MQDSLGKFFVYTYLINELYSPDRKSERIHAHKSHSKHKA